MAAPATKDDVEHATTQLRGELAAVAAELRVASKQDLADAVVELRRDLASKQDLAAVAAELRRDLASKQDLAAVAAELRRDLASKQDLAQLEHHLTLEIGRAATQVANVMAEHFRSQANVLDEKYQHLPPEVAALRSDFEGHRSDDALHVRALAAPAKRVVKKRASKPRSTRSR